MNSNNNANSPAFPCVPIQDNFGRLIAAIPGITKLEYFALKIYCSAENLIDYEAAIEEAEEFFNALEKHQNKKNDSTEAKILSID
jgi:hypothetical protein